MYEYYAQQNGKVYFTITAQFEVVRWRFSLSYWCIVVFSTIYSVHVDSNLYPETLYINQSINQSIKTDLYSAVCRKRIRRRLANTSHDFKCRSAIVHDA